MDESNTDAPVRLKAQRLGATKQGHPASSRFEALRRDFQDFLDRTFPIGVTCAVIQEDHGLDTASSGSTGRLVCAAVGVTEGQRWHEIVIDPVGRGNAEDESIRLRIGNLIRHDMNEDLWEAEVFDETPGCTLRINASPPAAFRPTAAMRDAIAERYGDLLPTNAGSS